MGGPPPGTLGTQWGQAPPCPSMGLAGEASLVSVYTAGSSGAATWLRWKPEVCSARSSLVKQLARSGDHGSTSVACVCVSFWNTRWIKPLQARPIYRPKGLSGTTKEWQIASPSVTKVPAREATPQPGQQKREMEALPCRGQGLEEGSVELPACCCRSVDGACLGCLGDRLTVLLSFYGLWLSHLLCDVFSQLASSSAHLWSLGATINNQSVVEDFGDIDGIFNFGSRFDIIIVDLALFLLCMEF